MKIAIINFIIILLMAGCVNHDMTMTHKAYTFHLLMNKVIVNMPTPLTVKNSQYEEGVIYYIYLWMVDMSFCFLEPWRSLTLTNMFILMRHVKRNTLLMLGQKTIYVGEKMYIASCVVIMPTSLLQTKRNMTE